jgi:hypothetical protein
MSIIRGEILADPIMRARSPSSPIKRIHPKRPPNIAWHTLQDSVRPKTRQDGSLPLRRESSQQRGLEAGLRVEASCSDAFLFSCPSRSRNFYPELHLEHIQRLHQGPRNANAWKMLLPKRSGLGHFLFPFPSFLSSCLGLRAVYAPPPATSSPSQGQE